MNLLSSSESESEESSNILRTLQLDGIAGNLKKKNFSAPKKDIQRTEFARNHLNINKAYAASYEIRKRNEDLSNNKEILESLRSDNESDSDSELEDEDAELLTSNVKSKIFQTLDKIKSKDPIIYQSDAVFFTENDFEVDLDKSIEHKEKPSSPVTYSTFVADTLLKHGPKVFDENNKRINGAAGGVKNVLSYKEEQDLLKKNFLDAADSIDTHEQQELLEINEDGHIKNIEACKYVAEGSDDIMRHYWASDEQLNENERFLRDYILNSGWIDTNDHQSSTNFSMLQKEDEEDEKHLVDTDNYESKYNFRYEEAEGKKIHGHPRTLDGSLRLKEDSRKRKRVQKKMRQDAEKTRREEELKRLKNLKKQEIMERILKIEKISGKCNIGGLIDLENDFDPSAHDKQMDTIFDEDYDNLKESTTKEELLKTPVEIQEIIGPENALLQSKSILRQQRKLRRYFSTHSNAELDDGEAYAPLQEGMPSCKKEEEAESGFPLASQVNQNSASPVTPAKERNINEWWMCDSCEFGILVNKRRFDCTVCENYTLCKKCHASTEHPHKFISKIIPDGCHPPKEYEPKLKRDLSEYLDEYFQLDYEDIIGGDLPTRFKYRQVEKNSFGFTTEDILQREDRELNAAVSLKKLAPYRQNRKEDNFKKEHFTSSKLQRESVQNYPQALNPYKTREGGKNFKPTSKANNIKQSSEMHAQKRNALKFGVPKGRLKAYGLVDTNV